MILLARRLVVPVVLAVLATVAAGLEAHKRQQEARRNSRDASHPNQPAAHGLLSVPMKVVASRRQLAPGGAWGPQQQPPPPPRPAGLHYLPRGPPPFKPSPLMVKLAAMPQLDKLNLATRGRSKVYYLFLDILQQLSLMVDKVSRKKLRLTDAKLEALRAVVARLAWKGGHSLKLRWPLVLLNPLFLKELFSSPTFLVMLFHAVELAYVSAPHKIWLRPLMKMIEQQGPEKEERVWWRRKRIYDSLYGPQSSELEPNLKAIHFRQPPSSLGPAPLVVPAMVRLVRLLSPAATEASQPPAESVSHQLPPNSFPTLPSPELIIPAPPSPGLNRGLHRPHQPEQLMSQEEFDGLDEAQKESLLRETRHRLEEWRWTNALIKHQTELVESMLTRPQEPQPVEPTGEEQSPAGVESVEHH